VVFSPSLETLDRPVKEIEPFPRRGQRRRHPGARQVKSERGLRVRQPLLLARLRKTAFDLRGGRRDNSAVGMLNDEPLNRSVGDFSHRDRVLELADDKVWSCRRYRIQLNNASPQKSIKVSSSWTTVTMVDLDTVFTSSAAGAGAATATVTLSSSNGRLPRTGETALRFLLDFRGVVGSVFSTSLSSSVPAKISGMGTDSRKIAAANWV
jgi:hypothetical protein